MAGGGHRGEGRGQESIQDSGLGVLTGVGSRPVLPAAAQGAPSSGQADRRDRISSPLKLIPGAPRRAEVWVGLHPQGVGKGPAHF